MQRRPTRVDVASRFMSLPRTWCRLLLRLVGELRPRSCLESGTAFGISGSYLAAALELNRDGRLITLEGAEDWARIASRSFAGLGLEARVEQRVGPIADSLAHVAAAGPFELAFLDAEHQAEPTLAHFAAMLPNLAPNAVVVLDDVDWPPMRDAGAARGARALGDGDLGRQVRLRGRRRTRGRLTWRCARAPTRRRPRPHRGRRWRRHCRP